MIDLREAWLLLEGETRPLDVREVSLHEAPGHGLAEAIVADRDFPPADHSAMDGFAVRARDLAVSRSALEIAGEVRAGAPAEDLSLLPGQAMRIFTGAVLPTGADAVVRVERSVEDVEAGTVTFDVRPAPGEHVRSRGQDLKAGDTVLEPGVRIGAAQVAALASVGRTRVSVHRRPVVRLLSTGDEVVEPDQTPLVHQVRNSNAAALMAQLAEIGLESSYLGIAGDQQSRLGPLLERGLSGDVLLITGGVSVGTYDLVRESLLAAGTRVLFHGVAVKPGKPILVGRCGDCLVFGLPGNPVAVFAGFVVFVAPALRRMMGYRAWGNVELPVVLAEDFPGKPGRQTYHLARVEVEDGRHTARRVSSTGSGDVLSLARANAFVVASADAGSQPAGTVLPALLFS